MSLSRRDATRISGATLAALSVGALPADKILGEGPAADALVRTASELDAEALQALSLGRGDNATRVKALLAKSLRELAEALR
jgi:hypothetical protein